MAEFVEVMKQRARMCIDDDTFCHACKLNQFASRFAENCNRVLMSHSEEAEKIIMDWAKEHPVKTNQEVLTETIEEKFGSEIAEMFTHRIVVSVSGCAFLDCRNGCKENGPCEYCKFVNFWNQEWKDPKEKANEP